MTSFYRPITPILDFYYMSNGSTFNIFNFDFYHFNHDLVSTTESEMQSKKKNPDLTEKISWLSFSVILNKAPLRLITKATETSVNSRKRTKFKKPESNIFDKTLVIVPDNKVAYVPNNKNNDV